MGSGLVSESLRSLKGCDIYNGRGGERLRAVRARDKKESQKGEGQKKRGAFFLLNPHVPSPGAQASGNWFLRLTQLL